MKPKPIVLVVDDDEEEYNLLEDNCKESATPCQLLYASTGDEALHLFTHALPRPNLVLLDYKMPRWNGLELLVKLKELDTTKRVPIVMVTGSRDPTLAERAYNLGANAVVMKPDGFSNLTTMWHRIYDFWIVKSRTVG